VAELPWPPRPAACDNPGMPFRLVAILGLAGLLSVACELSTPSNNKIDEISGTIPKAGSDFREFDVTKNGELQVTITSLVPTPSASLGMAIGQPSGGSCVLIAGYLAPMVANRTQEFGFLNKGRFCLFLYDTGAMAVDTTYAGKISHP
jgi:hypothetical protein